jgi:hypothetical protein
MTKLINALSRSRGGAAALAACVVAALAAPGTAGAGQYTVFACDSAGMFGYSSAAWVPIGDLGSAYAACPSGGRSTAGISNRLIARTYAGFSASGHSFTAPAGTTITRVRWAGRMARQNCHWSAYLRAVPSTAPVIGLRSGIYCDSTEFDNRGWPITLATPQGTTALQQLVICGSTECAPGATMHSQVVEVTVDDPVPPSISLDGPLASGQWVSVRTQPDLTTVASDNVGITSTTVSVGARTESDSYACDWTQARPCADRTNRKPFPVGDLADGHHVLTVSAADAAGNSAAASRDLYVDNTPPDAIAPDLAGGDAWRRSNNFSISWTNTPNNGAPVVRAHWKLCSRGGACVTRGRNDGRDVQGLPGLRVPAAGEYSLHVWLEDAAGNAREESGTLTATLRFDPEPPELAFEPMDANDPLGVVVSAIDRHSGIAQGEIEMRATGTTTWHGLSTNRERDRLVAHVNDERFRNGQYEFRARAVDNAGNEASTGRRSDGSAATLRLPARIDTRLAVGVARTVMRRKIERRHGRKRVVRRRIRQFDNSIVAANGRVVHLSGLLANADGQPIDGATIEALETRSDDGPAPIGLVTTGADGAFHYKLKAVRNRDVLFRYDGSRRIGSASAQVTLKVPATTAVRTDRSRLLNGQEVIFTGRVLTRPLPATGKLVEMQAYFRGGWRTFSTVRASASGRWRFPYRFGGTVGRVTYRFRARLPAEGGYPFISGTSHVIEVLVLGP